MEQLGLNYFFSCCCGRILIARTACVGRCSDVLWSCLLFGRQPKSFMVNIPNGNGLAEASVTNLKVPSAEKSGFVELTIMLTDLYSQISAM